MARTWLLAGSAWLAAAGGAHAAEQSCSDTAAGADIARRVCATCHVVAPDQKSAPALKEPTPSFAAIASRSTTTAQSLRTFIETTHWDRTSFPMQMPRLALSPEQVDAVVCYILSLRTTR
jgi:mono/diheme cytochrome c family protein